MKPDRYRRERRRQRADRLLIARKVDRETRRRIWRGVRLRERLGRQTCLSRAVLFVSVDLLVQVFPGWKPGWSSANGRCIRKARNRRAQRERMAAHQACERARIALAADLERQEERGYAL